MKKGIEEKRQTHLLRHRVEQTTQSVTTAYDNIQGTGTHFVSKSEFFQSYKKTDLSQYFVYCIHMEHISSGIFSTRGLVTKIGFYIGVFYTLQPITAYS